MTTKKVNNYELKAQSKTELDHIEELMNKAEYYKEEFQKYFHVWIQEGVGVFFFIKEKYFVSRNGVANYAIAMLQYGGNIRGLKNTELPVQK